METSTNLVETLLETMEDYGKTTIELTKLKTIQLTAKATSLLATQLIFFTFMSLMIILLSVGLALFIGDYFQKMYYGFFIVAAFYGLLAIIVRSFFYDLMKKPISEMIIAHFLE